MRRTQVNLRQKTTCYMNLTNITEIFRRYITQNNKVVAKIWVFWTFCPFFVQWWSVDKSRLWIGVKKKTSRGMVFRIAEIFFQPDWKGGFFFSAYALQGFQQEISGLRGHRGWKSRFSTKNRNLPQMTPRWCGMSLVTYFRDFRPFLGGLRFHL